MLSIGDICRRHRVKHHFYADDTQIYITFDHKSDTDRRKAIARLEQCIADIKLWMRHNMLKLNDDKTEVIFFGTNQRLPTVEDIKIQIGDVSVGQSSNVRNLGVIYDSTLGMERHINSVCRSCNFQLRNISRIRRYLTVDAAKTLVQALVISRLDYCNSLLYGLPNHLIQKLQRVQNTAARIVTRTSRFSHIRPVLQRLHWLPVHRRIQFKILVYTYKALHGTAPSYLAEMLHWYKPGKSLRSQNQLLLIDPTMKLKTYGDRSFAKAAPTLWNDLTLALRKQTNLMAFRSALKTHLFREEYMTM